MVGMAISTIMVIVLALIGAVTVCTKLLEIGDRVAAKTKNDSALSENK